MSGPGTTILWELAGRDNNLPFLIPLLKKHKEQVTEKHYTVSSLTLLIVLNGAYLRLDWPNFTAMRMFVWQPRSGVAPNEYGQSFIRNAR